MATTTRLESATSDSKSTPLSEQIAMSRPSDPASAQKGVDKLRQKRAWGITPEPFINVDLRSTCSDLVFFTIVIGFNKSAYARPFYTWLNDNFTPFQINCYGVFLITTAVYWAYGLLYMIMDLTERPAFLFKYKIQPYKRVTKREYWEICKIVLRNQLFVSLPLSALSAGPVSYLTGMGDTSYEGLPGAWKTIGTWVFCLLCEEVGFFYVHRALHQPKYYATYHKFHHTFTAPCALAATYATMLEHVLSNLFPIMLGLSILGAHWSMVIFFFCNLELGTLDTHSGYNIPGLHNATRHDWHHFSFNECYGPTGLLDTFYGSNSKFKTALKEAIALKGSRRAAEHHLAGQMAQMTVDE